MACPNHILGGNLIYTPYSRVILFIIGEYMKQTNIEARIAEINNRIAELPKGNISYHIKFSDRFDTLMQIEERRRLEDEKHLIEKYAQYINLVVARNPYLKNKGGNYEYFRYRNRYYRSREN